MKSLSRLLVQLVLLVVVVFFGYHYLTREELRSCVSAPLASLGGKVTPAALDQTKVEEFLTQVGGQFGAAASKSGQLWGSLNLQATGSSRETSLQDQLLDKGQYLYCRAVVDKVEAN